MKNLLKLEALGLFLFFSLVYFWHLHGTWTLYLSLFFVPDVSFVFYLVSSKVGAFFYNLLHHQGLLVMVVLCGFYLRNDLTISIGVIFLAHSFFDRVAGYGLKYPDSFQHTHLGWIGKSQPEASSRG